MSTLAPLERLDHKLMPTVTSPKRDAAVEASVFWYRFRKEIAAVFAVAVLGLGVYTGYNWYADRQEATAARALGGAKSVPDFQQVIDRYGGTAAGASAHLLLADAQRKEKKFLEANKTLEQLISKYPQHELVSTAEVAMAGNLESLGKTEEALSKFQRIAATYSKSYVAPFALLSQAELLKSKNRIDEARRAYEAILTNYRESIAAGEANHQLRQIQLAAPSQPAPGSTATQPRGPQPPAMLARPQAPAAPKPTNAPAAPGPKK